MEVTVTPEILSENEHSIVSLLSGSCLKQAVAIQTQLKQLFGNAIWLQEPQSLHATLMEVICDTDYGARSRLKLFEQWCAQYNTLTAEVLSLIEPFDIVFDELAVSQRAIIMKARQSGKFNGIRADLLSQIKLPEGTKNPPNITHSTLARFAEPLNLNFVRDQVKDIQVEVSHRVTEFLLIKNLGPPIFNGNPLEHYSFTKQ